MKKPMKIMLIVFIIVFGALIGFNVIKKLVMHWFFAHYQPPAVTVSSVTATSKTWTPYLHAVGNFKAVNGVDINSQISGEVTAIHFKSGQYVEANQPLIDIDDQVEQATLAFNKADLALQQVNYRRQLDLLKTHATSTANADETHAKMLEAEANVNKSQTLIQQKHIKAPFAGLLGLREINLGQYITPGQTSIVNLQALDPLYIEFFLPEQRLNQLHEGQHVSAALPNYPRFLFEGSITAISAKADENTHNIKIQATFSNCSTATLREPEHSKLIDLERIDQHTTRVRCNSSRNQQHHISDYAFIPGMFAELSIELPPMTNMIVLPATAVSYSLYGNSVYVIEHAGESNLVVKQVFISTGDQQGNDIIIKAGLKPGQEVANTGELKLKNGTRVVINNSLPLPSDTPKGLGDE